MKLFRYLLFPIVPVYYLVTWVRNMFYDFGIKKSKSYDFPVICVGNLSVGGTGKTPMVEFLIKLLKTDYKLATLSRGYGRKTKGFVLATNNDTAKSIGDEPFQFYKKFKNNILVAVDENRQNGIEKLRGLKNKPNIIILDDAFQHRKVKAKLNILLTTFSNIYTNDIVLPTGNLREPKSGANRAQIIVVTKCPTNLSSDKKMALSKKIKLKTHQELYFSSINYSDIIFSKNNSLVLNTISKFTLITGIANAKPLVNYLKSNSLTFNHLEYKDHYAFTKKDIEFFAKKELIITTEKDYVRLNNFPEIKDILYYLPITVTINDCENFVKRIKAAL